MNLIVRWFIPEADTWICATRPQQNMKMIKFLSSVVLGLALSLRACDADTIAVVPGTGGQQNNLWGGDATIGWQFTLASSITVTELGFFAPSNSLSDPHPVGIWDGSG